MKPALRFHEAFPRAVPWRPRSNHGGRSEAFGLSPRQLFGSQIALRGTVGQIQTHGNRHRFKVAVDANNAFHLVVDFTGMLANWNRATAVKASRRFDEENRFDGGLVAKFQGVFGEGSDGAPHGHDLMTAFRFIKSAMPKDDSPAALVRPMANEWSIRKRRPVRRKHIAPLLKTLESDLAIDLNVDGAFLEMAEYGPWTMVFVDRTPLVIELLDEEEERCVFLTLRGFLQHMDALKWVEVDHGAIPFLMNGADCMVAGVHGAEPSVQAGDLVWVRDMTHKRPLALGWAMDEASALVENTKGKGIKTVHWVGDELWEME